MRLLPLILACLITASCDAPPEPTCKGPTIIHPTGACSAHYEQNDYGSGNVTTLALIMCRTSEVNLGVLSSSESMGDSIVSVERGEHGIGLKWTGPDTLEIALPMGANISEKKYRFPYNDKVVRFEYRLLGPQEAEYRGCKGRQTAR